MTSQKGFIFSEPALYEAHLCLYMYLQWLHIHHFCCLHSSVCLLLVQNVDQTEFAESLDMIFHGQSDEINKYLLTSAFKHA